MEESVALLLERSRKAQEIFATFSQEQVDAVVRSLAKVVYDRAEELARMAHEETRMGVYADKVKKNQGKAKIIWQSLKGKKSIGVIADDPLTGVTQIAKPMGVIGAVTPCTNPIVTPMCNAMFALKCCNAMIIAPHPRAKKCAAYLTGLFQAELKALGAPEDLILCIEEPTLEKTNELMRSADVVVATGGMNMVKAAYSSGKPAFGVGAGNVQCIVDRQSGLEEAIHKILAGRLFDNGIICSGEQTVMIHEDEYDQAIALMSRHGAHVIRDAGQVEKIRSVLFPDGVMNKHLVGQPAGRVAEMAGLSIPAETTVIVVEGSGSAQPDILCREKMCPVLTLFPYKTFAEAVDIAMANLAVEGRGHSISIHSRDPENIAYAAQCVPVCRVLVNQICSTMNGGSFNNGFTATTTLGCGSWGNNSISENLDYKHLMNITRIGRYLEQAVVPSDEEIWG
ncbi:MAG: aldehyde dehydrogenase family protein [Ruminococcaceae bacterium]|nr:aldehyde dehydrogenase family protein [Oscillospiraceae bacterium]